MCRMLMLLLLTGMWPARMSAAETIRVYFGTSTRGGDSEGIYVGDFDLVSGRLRDVRLACATDDPSFLEIHPSGRTLLSVGAPGRGGKHLSEPSLVAWRIDGENGALAMTSRAPSRGTGPCHVSISGDGKYAGVANYGSGSVALYALGSDGDLRESTGFFQQEGRSAHPTRQTGPHAHSVQFAPGGRFALCADLGTDELRVYEIVDGELEPWDPPSAKLAAGAGPRHFSFSRCGRYVFVINELDGTITTLRWGAGELSEVETVEVLPGQWQAGYTTAEILVHPGGRFVYGSVRGHDSIVVFEFDEATRRLSRVGHVPSGGKTPRNFRLTPDGDWLLAANQDSDSVVVFRIDEATGMPQPTDQAVQVPKPVCIRFHPGRW